VNKEEFLDNPDVMAFGQWAASALPAISVQLRISNRGTGQVRGCNGDPTTFGPGVSGRFVGIESITNAYQWLGRWVDAAGNNTDSCNWVSTHSSLRGLSQYLKDCIGNGALIEVQNCCSQILLWGGDRNPAVGAGRFINELDGNLINYLIASKQQYSLASANTDHTDSILEMNAMLTKIHALASDDGLPIYDSRVAAAIGCLVEIYRQSMNPPWFSLPDPLVFKSVDNSVRRRVTGMTGLPHPVLDPGRICRATTTKGKLVRSREWSSSKIRLGWLMEQIISESITNKKPLFTNLPLLDDSMTAKMHALEAALFMIGFDVTSLSDFQFAD